MIGQPQANLRKILIFDPLFAAAAQIELLAADESVALSRSGRYHRSTDSHGGHAVSKDQLAIFLFTALLASAALLTSAFGSLYSVYGRFITESASICVTIWWICYTITATVFVITITAGTVLAFLSPLIDSVAYFIKYALYLVLVVMNVAPLTVSWRMFQDGRA